jgi:surface protein
MALGAGLSTRAVVKPQGRFRTRWVVTDGFAKTIYLPLRYDGTHDFTVDWGDGTTERITNASNTSGDGPWITNYSTFGGFFAGVGWKHVYSSAGTYYVTITGKLEGWGIDDNATIKGSFAQLAEVYEWGPLELGGGSDDIKHFYPCPNMVWSATDRLNLGNCTNLYQTFGGCASLGSNGFVNMNTSAVTDFALMFYGCDNFNMDFSPEFSTESLAGGGGAGLYAFLGTSSTGSFTKSFPDAFMAHCNRNTDFGFFLQNQVSYNNSQISNLNTSNTTNAAKMFEGCTAFNQNISGWDVSLLTNATSMFQGCTAFNQNISGWDVSLLTDATSFMEDCDNYSTANYDALLTAWNAQNVSDDVTIHFGDQTKYTGGGSAASARADLVSSHNWSITDGGTA